MSVLTSTLSPRATHAPLAAHASAKPRKWRRFFARFLDRMIEARMERARLVLERHGVRLPIELEGGLKIKGRNEDSLPFVR
jgi:hypothetical protein